MPISAGAENRKLTQGTLHNFKKNYLGSRALPSKAKQRRNQASFG
jgi:hypothetical protein